MGENGKNAHIIHVLYQWLKNKSPEDSPKFILCFQSEVTVLSQLTKFLNTFKKTYKKSSKKCIGFLIM